MWTRDADFIHLVEAHITAAYQKKDPFICLFWYLHRTRKELQKLNKHQYADLKSQLSKARNDLEKIQAHLFEDPMNKQLAQRENTQRNHYTLILSSVIDILRQQCKAEWLAYGDECTRYFFAKAKQRKTSSYIFELHDDQGKLHQGFPAVASILQHYYKSQLGEQLTHKGKIDPQVISMGNVLSIEQQFDLCAPFSDNDIKNAIFSIPHTKSPGPDGFSSGFFKSTWHITGGLVIDAVRHFFATSKMPGFLGETKLILLPKIPNPSQAKDFRPISCCNVVYKCIAKLLCLRLKQTLPHLIHQNQGAFVKGRELLFNVLTCQDLVRGYTRKGISPRCIMKIDLHKAFDSVHLDFLKELMDHMRFPTQFVSWLMACISSVSYRIHVNGHIGELFKGGRGLKQGDPLSPLLFVLSMEYFTRLMVHASNNPNFSFHPSCKALKMSHLMFADDVMIFCKAKPETLLLVHSTLMTFYQCTGLKVNQTKSQMAFGGCSPLLEVTGFQEGSLPLKYLGMPMTVSRLTKLECMTLVEKITGRIRLLSTKSASFAGSA